MPTLMRLHEFFSVSELKAKAMRTLARLREGKDLDTEGFELVTNVMESFVVKLTTGERIRFQRKRQTNSILTAMRSGAIRFCHPDRG